MAPFKQKASLEASSYGHPLPFRSREPANLGNQHVSWAPTNSVQELKAQSHIIPDKRSYSPADKENVKSWLNSTSPTSVLKSYDAQQHVQSGAQLDPPTPSPVCSPSPSSPLSSPRSSIVEPVQEEAVSPRSSIVEPVQEEAVSSLHINHQNASTQVNSQAEPDSGKKLEDLASSSTRQGRGIGTGAPPDSPTGSAISSGSEGGLLALLASKLLSYKENDRRFSRYARETSGPIDEKHVMEDRSKKPPVEEINIYQVHPRSQGPVTGNGIYRTSSEAVSENSLGSANDRSLSMEFDAMLAAAVATGISQASASPDQSQQPLPDIQEHGSSRFGSFVVHQPNDVDSRALVRVGDMRRTSSDDEASRLISALTVMRQGRESEEMDFNSTLSEFPLSTRSSISSGSRRAIAEDNNMQIVPTIAVASIESTDAGHTSTNGNRESSFRSSSTGSNGEHRLAMVLATHDHTAGHDHTSRTSSDPGESTPSSSSSGSVCKDTNVAPIIPLPPRQALEKVRRDKAFAQALAFQDAQSSKCTNRYIREESKIVAWENQQKIKASIRMKKVEMKLEQKRAKAVEKMQNEIARAHKRAEERKACAEAVRAAKTAKAAELADSIRRTGNSPPSGSVGCFPF